MLQFFEFCRTDGRICPAPKKWDALWKVLNKVNRGLGGDLPAPPLILSAWHYSNNLEKTIRFSQQVEWAHEHGQLKEVWNFLSGLTVDDWHSLDKPW